MKNTIRNILNDLKWNDKYNEHYFSLKYIHRGAPRNYKKIKVSEILEVLSAFFTIKGKEFDNEIVNIPFHRIIEIRNDKTNQILYEKHS